MVELESNSNYASYEKDKNEYKAVFTMVNLDETSDFVNNDEHDYYLLYEEAYCNNNTVFNINAIVNENGNYINFVFQTKLFERVIKSDGVVITSDIIFSKDKNVYYSTLMNDKIEIEEYFKMNPSFISADMKKFDDSSDMNNILLEFIVVNRELKNQLRLKKNI